MQTASFRGFPVAVASFLWVVLLMFLALATADETIMLNYFHADSLYLPSIYKDLVLDGGSLRGWHLNHAPGFFPDMPLFFLLSALSGGNFIVATWLFGAVQLGLLTLALRGILKHLGVSPVTTVWMHLAIALFFTEQIISGKFNYMAFLSLMNAYHLGAFLNAAWAWRLLLSKRKPLLGLLIPLSLTAVVSDKLFVIYFLLPSMALQGLELRTSQRIRSNLPVLLLLISLAAGGWILSGKLANAGIYSVVSADNKVAYLEGIPNAVAAFWESFARLSETSPVSVGLMIVTLLTYVYLSVSYVKNAIHREATEWETWFWWVISATLFAPLVSGAFTGLDAWRYNLPAMFLLWLVQARYVAHLGIRLWHGRMILAGLCAVTLFITAFQTEGLRKNLNFYPKYVKAFDALAVAHNLKYGVAEYWDAKPILMFSKQGVRVYTAFAELTPWYHVMNENWYYRQQQDPSQPVDFGFIVYSSPVQKRRADALFNQAYDSVGTDPKVLITPPFRFDRETYQAYRVKD
jgi:hypothetical protein